MGLLLQVLGLAVGGERLLAVPALRSPPGRCDRGAAYEVPGCGPEPSGKLDPSPPSKQTPTYHEPFYTEHGQYCVEAYALSVDGGVKNTACF